MKRFGGARGAGNHVDCGGASAAQVFVREIEQPLIVGIGMDGGHGPAVDAECVLNDFGDRREAIGGAGGVGNDVVLRGVVALVVHAKNKGGVGTVGRGRNDDFLYRGAEMLLGIGTFGEQAGGFDDDFRANRSPIELGGILCAEYLEALAFDRDSVVGVGHLMRQIAQHGIVFEQMR